MDELKLIRNNVFPYDILIIDGQGRSGKNMISVILSTMPRVEKMRLDSLLDYVPRYWSLGKMSHDAAITSLKIEADEKLYNTMISRSVNFRFDDYTGVLKSGKPFLYIKRLFQKPEKFAVERMKKENPIFQNMTHDGIHLSQLYFDAYGERLKMVHVFRDPVGNIYEQGLRDFGTRIGTDPREFQLTYEWNGNVIPLMAEGTEDEYINGNPTERLVLLVNNMYKKNIKGYLDLEEKYKSKILFLEFEEFAVNPWPYLTLLEQFLGTYVVPRTRRIMKRERCPRSSNAFNRESRIAEIEKKISLKYADILHNLISDYDEKPWINYGFKGIS
ncbi:MAG: hypothetical protein A2X18_05515 [Bacteroidetes bacterium GWF2_40_14]|nr:MAG: hypothetical protein A2X18_05515 [Bacteroidetes bacterium GWF2_40_14]